MSGNNGAESDKNGEDPESPNNAERAQHSKDASFQADTQSETKDEAANQKEDDKDAQSADASSFPKNHSQRSCKMHRLSLYETASHFLLVGGDVQDMHFRMIRIRRSDAGQALEIEENENVYTKKEMNQLLETMHNEGKTSTGGLKPRGSFWGLLGCIRLTGPYYMVLITKRSQIAVIGGHYVYQIDGTELVSIATATASRFRGLETEESRMMTVMGNVDLSRSFYFSYAYDITSSLQTNIVRGRRRSKSGDPLEAEHQTHESIFRWNNHLIEPVASALTSAQEWCLDLIHGFVNQAVLSVYGRTIHITLIARRSRFFAGARFLKRGANDLGHVANDVETEQIVADMMTTSLHAPGPNPFSAATYTSFLQHRGSIPLHWTQDSSGVSPKPDIDLYLNDPFYTAAARHFDNLFERYGAPVYVLNLVKARERTPRESILLKEFTNAITYLNQSLPEAQKIRYRAWDMSRASKSRDQNVITTLELIAAEVVQLSGFFHNGDGAALRLQNGVTRTNCIDCLDRTNAAQFVIGKRALGLQLQALGIIQGKTIEFDTDASNLFTQMYHDHGDEIAVQYGGSHLVNTMETYRKINQWTSQSRDMVESFKRYYNNSFLDKQRQEAFNLFLGNYRYDKASPLLWDLPSDYFLHHAHPQKWIPNLPRSYVHWFSPENLKPRDQMKVIDSNDKIIRRNVSSHLYDDYWLEYYRPQALSSFAKMFQFKTNSTLRYMPLRSIRDVRLDQSPFCVRERISDHSSAERASMKDAEDEFTTPEQKRLARLQLTPRVPSASHDRNLPGLIQHAQEHVHDIMSDVTQTNPNKTSVDDESKTKKSTQEKLMAAQWTLRQFFNNSLNPDVSTTEANEYARYIDHPSRLPLVTDVDKSSDPRAMTAMEYLKTPQLESMPAVDDSDLSMSEYVEYVKINHEPLTVTENDLYKKRYKAYRQWMKGKSLFKQRADP